MVGDQSSIPEQQETNNEMLENVDLEGGEVINIEDVDGVVGGERLEFREEQVQCVRKKGIEEQRVLTALALLEEVILDQRRQKIKGNRPKPSLHPGPPPPFAFLK